MDERCSFAEAARIAGIKESTLRVVKKRAPELFRSEWFSPPDGPGLPGQVDREGVIFLAIFAQLAALGIGPRDCAEAAWHFSDLVSPGTDFAWPEDNLENRSPGEVFGTGRTLMLVYAKRGGGIQPRLLNLLDDAFLLEALKTVHLFSDSMQQRGQAIAVIDMNDLIARVDMALAESGSA